MTAIVAGNGLGLSASSQSQLNGFGSTGRAQIGLQGRDAAYVNASTGNLVVQSQDEFVAAVGLDHGIFRTYNAQGAVVDGDNNDSWRLSVYRSLDVTALTNTLKQPFNRTDSDGHVANFVYEATSGFWFSSEGSGSRDVIALVGTQWEYRKDGGLMVERYDNNGRLLSTRDEMSRTVTYGYTGSLITSITDQSGQITYLDYSGNNLSAVRVVGLRPGATVGTDTQTLTRVRYNYDALNRLTQVTTDLTPDDNSTVDGKRFVVTYEYDLLSGRVSKIVQSDGSSLTISYEGNLVQGYRVKTLTDGEGRVTTFTYDTAVRTTTVADAAGNSTVYSYDTASRLISVTLPTVSGISVLARVQN